MAVTEEVDGRRLRREQNRESVLDALVELFREGLYQPSSNQIAERAGLSPRSLFRYFDDIDDLIHAAAERQLRRASSLVEVDAAPSDPTSRKIGRVVEARARLFEEIAPAARAARVCAHRHPDLATELHAGRVYLRRQLRELFGPEISSGSDAVFPAIDVLCSFESYELLRFDHGLSRQRTVSTITAALDALLLSPGGSR